MADAAMKHACVYHLHELGLVSFRARGRPSQASLEQLFHKYFLPDVCLTDISTLLRTTIANTSTGSSKRDSKTEAVYFDETNNKAIELEQRLRANECRRMKVFSMSNPRGSASHSCPAPCTPVTATGSAVATVANTCSSPALTVQIANVTSAIPINSQLQKDNLAVSTPASCSSSAPDRDPKATASEQSDGKMDTECSDVFLKNTSVHKYGQKEEDDLLTLCQEVNINIENGRDATVSAASTRHPDIAHLPSIYNDNESQKEASNKLQVSSLQPRRFHKPTRLHRQKSINRYSVSSKHTSRKTKHTARKTRSILSAFQKAYEKRRTVKHNRNIQYPQKAAVFASNKHVTVHFASNSHAQSIKNIESKALIEKQQRFSRKRKEPLIDTQAVKRFEADTQCSVRKAFVTQLEQVDSLLWDTFRQEPSKAATARSASPHRKERRECNTDSSGCHNQAGVFTIINTKLEENGTERKPNVDKVNTITHSDSCSKEDTQSMDTTGTGRNLTAVVVSSGAPGQAAPASPQQASSQDMAAEPECGSDQQVWVKSEQDQTEEAAGSPTTNSSCHAKPKTRVRRAKKWKGARKQEGAEDVVETGRLLMEFTNHNWLLNKYHMHEAPDPLLDRHTMHEAPLQQPTHARSSPNKNRKKTIGRGGMMSINDQASSKQRQSIIRKKCQSTRSLDCSEYSLVIQQDNNESMVENMETNATLDEANVKHTKNHDDSTISESKAKNETKVDLKYSHEKKTDATHVLTEPVSSNSQSNKKPIALAKLKPILPKPLTDSSTHVQHNLAGHVNAKQEKHENAASREDRERPDDQDTGGRLSHSSQSTLCQVCVSIGNKVDNKGVVELKEFDKDKIPILSFKSKEFAVLWKDVSLPTVGDYTRSIEETMEEHLNQKQPGPTDHDHHSLPEHTCHLPEKRLSQSEEEQINPLSVNKNMDILDASCDAKSIKSADDSTQHSCLTTFTQEHGTKKLKPQANVLPINLTGITSLKQNQSVEGMTNKFVDKTAYMDCREGSDPKSKESHIGATATGFMFVHNDCEAVKYDVKELAMDLSTTVLMENNENANESADSDMEPCSFDNNSLHLTEHAPCTAEEKLEMEKIRQEYIKVKCMVLDLENIEKTQKTEQELLKTKKVDTAKEMKRIQKLCLNYMSNFKCKQKVEKLSEKEVSLHSDDETHRSVLDLTTGVGSLSNVSCEGEKHVSADISHDTDTSSKQKSAHAPHGLSTSDGMADVNKVSEVSAMRQAHRKCNRVQFVIGCTPPEAHEESTIDYNALSNINSIFTTQPPSHIHLPDEISSIPMFQIHHKQKTPASPVNEKIERPLNLAIARHSALEGDKRPVSDRSPVSKQPKSDNEEATEAINCATMSKNTCNAINSQSSCVPQAVAKQIHAFSQKPNNVQSDERVRQKETADDVYEVIVLSDTPEIGRPCDDRMGGNSRDRALSNRMSHSHHNATRVRQATESASEHTLAVSKHARSTIGMKDTRTISSDIVNEYKTRYDKEKTSYPPRTPNPVAYVVPNVANVDRFSQRQLANPCIRQRLQHRSHVPGHSDPCGRKHDNATIVRRPNHIPPLTPVVTPQQNTPDYHDPGKYQRARDKADITRQAPRPERVAQGSHEVKASSMRCEPQGVPHWHWRVRGERPERPAHHSSLPGTARSRHAPPAAYRHANQPAYYHNPHTLPHGDIPIRMAAGDTYRPCERSDKEVYQQRSTTFRNADYPGETSDFIAPMQLNEPFVQNHQHMSLSCSNQAPATNSQMNNPRPQGNTCGQFVPPAHYESHQQSSRYSMELHSQEDHVRPQSGHPVMEVQSTPPGYHAPPKHPVRPSHVYHKSRAHPTGPDPGYQIPRKYSAGPIGGNVPQQHRGSVQQKHQAPQTVLCASTPGHHTHAAPPHITHPPTLQSRQHMPAMYQTGPRSGDIPPQTGHQMSQTNRTSPQSGHQMSQTHKIVTRAGNEISQSHQISPRAEHPMSQTHRSGTETVYQMTLANQTGPQTAHEMAQPQIGPHNVHQMTSGDHCSKSICQNQSKWQQCAPIQGSPGFRYMKDQDLINNYSHSSQSQCNRKQSSYDSVPYECTGDVSSHRMPCMSPGRGLTTPHAAVPQSVLNSSSQSSLDQSKATCPAQECADSRSPANNAARNSGHANMPALATQFRCHTDKCTRDAEFVCSGCHKVAYCCPDCQVKDWSSHNSACTGDDVN